MTSQDRLKQIYHIVFMISEAITDFNNRYDKKSVTEKDLIKQICDHLDYRVEHQDFCDSFFALRNDVKALDIVKQKCLSNTNLWLASCCKSYESYTCFVKNKDHELVRTERNELTEEEYNILHEWIWRGEDNEESK